MGKRRESGGRPGPSDPKLLDRLVEYGRERQLSDIDIGGAEAYLRQKYPEYKRKKAGPFRKYLALQVPEVRRRIEARKKKEEIEARNVLRSGAEVEEGDAHMVEATEGGSREILPGNLTEAPVIPATSRSLIERPPASIGVGVAAEIFQLGSVEQQGNRPYIPLVPILESTGVVMGKRKGGREMAGAGSKKGRWEEGEREDRHEVVLRSGGESSWATALPHNVSFRDFGGIEDVLTKIREIIVYPFLHRNVYDRLGILLPIGVLLHGPPGCGKTMLANAIAVETGLPFLKIYAPEVFSGVPGESEAKVRSLFAHAVKVAPCIVFIDEIDAITPERETAQSDVERRIVAQLSTCMDDLSLPLADVDSKSEIKTQKRPAHVLVLGATDRPDAMDPALRRPGRFDREIALSIPDGNARALILSALSRKFRVEGAFDFARIAIRTPGFVGADLAALFSEAATFAMKRTEETRFTTDVYGDHEKWIWTDEQLEHLAITMEDLENAVAKVQFSGKREGFTPIPNVTWEDVGSLADIREGLEWLICKAIKNRDEYQALGMDVATGVLLYGPPGCGKTLVAKAVANDAGASFISVKGRELLNNHVGESERAIHQLFTRARAASPCIIFFDEMDAMAPKSGSDGNGATERVVNQLVTEMDALERGTDVFIIAATNRPDILDPALLRHGRLQKLLYVPVPDSKGRASISRTLVRKTPLAPDVDVSAIGESEQCEGFSGADLYALVREACVAALKEKTLMANEADNMSHTMGTKPDHFVTTRHFEIALARVFPSVSDTNRKLYEAFSASSIGVY